MNNNDYLEPAPVVAPSSTLDETVIAADGYSTQEQPRRRGENPALVHIDELPYLPDVTVTQSPSTEVLAAADRAYFDNRAKALGIAPSSEEVILDAMQTTMKQVYEGNHPDYQPGDYVVVRKDGSSEKIEQDAHIAGGIRSMLSFAESMADIKNKVARGELTLDAGPVEGDALTIQSPTVTNVAFGNQDGTEAVIVKAGDPNHPTGGHLAGDASNLIEGITAYRGELPAPVLALTDIDDINRKQYGEDLSPAQLAFLRGEGNELSTEETADLERRLALHPPQFHLDSLPSDEEAELPPLTESERADLMAGLDKINAGQATQADIAKLRQMLGEMPKMRSLLVDLKRMQKQYPMIFGRHVHVKQRTSKTRKKKR